METMQKLCNQYLNRFENGEVGLLEVLEELSNANISMTDEGIFSFIVWLRMKCLDYTAERFEGFDKDYHALVCDVKEHETVCVIKVLPVYNYLVEEGVIEIRFRRIKK